jgi:hypothetical protein
MKYPKFSFIYPPRPKNSVSPTELNYFENQCLIAQPKINGSNTVLFLNKEQLIVMNRHGQRLTGFSINTDEILSLYKGTGGWMVLNAEYLNKSQTDETGRVFNHKLIIFDILVYDSNYLVGSTFESRVKLLDELYGNKECDKEYLYNISENVYRVKTYTENFENLFNNLIKIGMYEGLVFKRMSGKLEMGLRELNTCASQFKIRKGTKSYKY